jgi:hypothetical protein
MGNKIKTEADRQATPRQPHAKGLRSRLDIGGIDRFHQLVEAPMRKWLLCVMAAPGLALPSFPCSAASSAPLIAETAHLVMGKERGQYSGSIALSSGSAGCRMLVFEPDLTKLKGPIGNVAIDRKSPGGMSNMQINSTVTTRGGGAYAELWVADVQYTIKGKVCLPAKWWDPVVTVLRLNYSPQAGGSIAMLGNGAVSSTPVHVKGMAGLKVPDGVGVIEVASDEGSPLRFVMTPKGLRYDSGSGSVTVPSGKQYTYGAGK